MYIQLTYVHALTREWKLLLFLSILCLPYYSIAQVESKNSFTADIGIRGRWQTGNLNQLGLIPNANLQLKREKYSLQIRSKYQYLKVDGFNAINDFWTFSHFKLHPEKKIHPLFVTYYGYAKSYRIAHSFYSGLGLGINLRQKSKMDFIEIGFSTGFMNFQFEQRHAHKSTSLGFIFETSYPLGEKLFISNDLKSYHSIQKSAYWGASNQLTLHLQLKKNMDFNISQEIVFNNENAEGIKKLNTLLLFGIQYRFKTDQKNLNLLQKP